MYIKPLLICYKFLNQLIVLYDKTLCLYFYIHVYLRNDRPLVQVN